MIKNMMNGSCTARCTPDQNPPAVSHNPITSWTAPLTADLERLGWPILEVFTKVVGEPGYEYTELTIRALGKAPGQPEPSFAE